MSKEKPLGQCDIPIDNLLYKKRSYAELSSEFKKLFPTAHYAFQLIPQMYNRLTLIDKFSHKVAIARMYKDHKKLPGFSGRNVLPKHSKNNGKYTEQNIANTLATFIFSPNGTVQINITCSNNAFKIETEVDRIRLLVYFGQIKECLVQLLSDNHQRSVVSDVPDWYLTECEINKDIKVSHLLQVVGLKIQVKHLDHLFSIYIKSLGPDTVCRVEEKKHFKPNKPVLEAINDIFNPYARIENKINFLSDQFRDLIKLLKGVDSTGPDTN